MKEDVFVIIGKEISWNFHIHVKALKCNFMRKPVKAYLKWTRTTSGEPPICMKSYLGSKWSHSKQFFWSFFDCHPVNLIFSYNLLLWNVLKSYVVYQRNKTFFYLQLTTLTRNPFPSTASKFYDQNRRSSNSRAKKKYRNRQNWV